MTSKARFRAVQDRSDSLQRLMVMQDSVSETVPGPRREETVVLQRLIGTDYADVSLWTLLANERAILVFVATDDADRAHAAILAALNALDAGEE